MGCDIAGVMTAFARRVVGFDSLAVHQNTARLTLYRFHPTGCRNAMAKRRPLKCDRTGRKSGKGSWGTGLHGVVASFATRIVSGVQFPGVPLDFGPVYQREIASSARKRSRVRFPLGPPKVYGRVLADSSCVRGNAHGKLPPCECSSVVERYFHIVEVHGFDPHLSHHFSLDSLRFPKYLRYNRRGHYDD
jgi:hypothetical protein